MTSNQPRPRTRLSLRSNSVHYDSLSTEQPDSDTPFMRTNPISQKRSYITVAVLCYINLLNYMDRYTIAGVLLSIQNYFGIPDSTSGLLQTGISLTNMSIYCVLDLCLLFSRSFVWSSLGVTAMAFVTGALAFWTPTFLSRAQVTQGLRPPCKEEPCNPLDSYIFGAITVVTGIVGVFLGTYISKQLRDRLPNADPLICAVGMLSSSPCFFIAIILAATSIPATYTFIAIGETLLSLNWAILADILLYVVVPTRRATAEALQIMVCHLLGDAGSPYLIGISDALLKYDQESPHWDFRRLEYSILLCPIIGILGGVFFFMTSLYIKEDRKAAELLNSGNNVLL
uniref:Spinster homolog 3 (Drosophila) n=1 Tax=Cyprinus carpio TaxID=7962 RepID=A0A8C1TIF6_CYPCA